MSRKKGVVSVQLGPEGSYSKAVSHVNLWDLDSQTSPKLVRSTPDTDYYMQEVDITDIKKKKGIRAKKDYSASFAAVAVLLLSAVYWFLYVTEIFPIWNIFAYFTVNLAVLILVSFKINDIKDDEPSYEKVLDYFQYTSLVVISVMLTDILFEVYWFSSWIGAPNIYLSIISNVAVILVLMILNNVIYLWAVYKRNTEMPVSPKGVKDFRAEGLSYKGAVAKKTLRGTRLLARNISIMMLILCIAALIWLGQQTYVLASVLNEAPEGLPHEQIGFAEALCQAFISLTGYESSAAFYEFFGITEAQYGASTSFTMVFEMLFYNQTTGIMLALMVIGTFANIFVINQTKSSALQSATTMTVIGIPMIMIVSMFLGVIPPPGPFVRLFGAEAIASFVFTFAMLSVYIIFLSMMMVFSHAAEIFQPGEED